MTLGTKESDVNWSTLPVLILWMIKDKLDIFDDSCVSAVCRNWLYASLHYPKKQVVGDGMPWIMQKKNEDEISNSSSWDFINVTSKKKFTIVLPDVRNSIVLFSKQGWVLMRQRNINVCNSKETLPDSVFIINPLTKAKIQLPDVADLREYYGCFSTHAGYPQQVVLLCAGESRQTLLRTAYPGDIAWTEHYSIQHPIFEGCCGLISTKEQIYYITIRGKMTVYTISKQIWKVLLPSPVDETGIAKIVEHEGNLIKLFVGGNEEGTLFSLSTYNDTRTEWESPSEDFHMNNISWYLSRLHNCLCARDRGAKAYVLDPIPLGPFRSRFRAYNVICYDLIEGNAQILKLPYKISSSAKWVDVG